jgi:hypothetical protein
MAVSGGALHKVRIGSKGRSHVMLWKSLFVVAVAAMTAAASAQPAAPAPGLSFAFSIRVEVAPPVEQGEIDGARQRFIPITGGTVSGPRLTGKVLPGGGDWQAIHPGGRPRSSPATRFRPTTGR